MTFDQILNDTIDKLIVKYKDNYNRTGLKASGQWPNVLRSEVVRDGVNLKGSVIGANYTYWLVNGRNAGKWPPKEVILQWIKDKGIKSDIPINSLAFLIQRKIGTKGIQVPNEYNDGTLLQGTDEFIKELASKLTFATIQEIKSDIIILK